MSAPASYRLSPQSRRIFIGLMLGMLVASISQTIVGPAMPRIVAELGGMAHYSWVATAAMLVSAIVVPIVGKLSDLYGRREFYLGGLAVFLLGSLLCGLATNFWFLVAGRAVQGLGMGTLMPLSQTIIGDIIPPRQRGKYQGLMGAVFGVTSVAGPLAGGFITDNFGWRWLFWLAIPVGLMALVVIARFLHLPHPGSSGRVDYLGMALMAAALTCLLLATSWGGTTYPWSSATILGLYAVGAVLLIAFLWVELRVSDPVLPLRMFRSRVFTLSNIASFGVAMIMFGAIIYIPVFAQGVVGVNATNSGLILMPMMLGMIVLSILVGLLITRTGHYKSFILVGVALLGVGFWMLSRLGYGSSQWDVTLAMVVVGIGLGMSMQVYTLIVQNDAAQAEMGVATATTQFFRNVGSTVGIALFGTLMTSRLPGAIAEHLPPGAADRLPADGSSAGAVLDPSVLSTLPPAVAEGVRMGLAESISAIFIAGLPIAVIVLLVSFFIPHIPLRDTLHGPEDEGHLLLDAMSQSSAERDRATSPQGSVEGSVQRGPTRATER